MKVSILLSSMLLSAATYANANANPYPTSYPSYNDLQMRCTLKTNEMIPYYASKIVLTDSEIKVYGGRYGNALMQTYKPQELKFCDIRLILSKTIYSENEYLRASCKGPTLQLDGKQPQTVVGQHDTFTVSISSKGSRIMLSDTNRWNGRDLRDFKSVDVAGSQDQCEINAFGYSDSK